MRIIGVEPADAGHQVVSLQLTTGRYRRQPCRECPWRVDTTGVWPAQAFRVSARTAYDMAEHTFGCHETGRSTPMTCAGFLLRGAEHNLTVRMALSAGRIDLSAVTDGGHALHPSYRAMAEANGVDPADPALRECR